MHYTPLHAMEVFERSETVDPEVRAFVSSLVSAVHEVPGGACWIRCSDVVELGRSLCNEGFSFSDAVELDGVMGRNGEIRAWVPLLRRRSVTSDGVNAWLSV